MKRDLTMRHQEQQTHDTNPDVVRSEPVPVSSTGSDDRADDRIDDDGRYDAGVAADDHPDSPRHADDDPTTIDARDEDDNPERAGGPEFHDPAPVPSALGAPTVGGAVAAAALANGERGKPDPRAEQTTAPGDGASDDADGRATGTTAVGMARPVSEEGGILSAGEAGVPDAGHRVGAYPVDPAQEDRDRVDASGSAGAADPDETTDRHLASDQGDPADGDDFDGTADDGALLPGAVPVDPVGALVSADAAQGFRDRWRDVQLRFVDDPRGAATEARELVGDVVESLSAALTAQRDALNDWQDGEDGDTERLRVAVRRYRDLVDRMLSL